MYSFFITAYVMVAKRGTEIQLGEGKDKIHPRTVNEGPDGEYTFFNLGARWGEWSTPRPDGFTPGRTRFPFHRRLGEPQGWNGRVRKNSRPPGFDLHTVQQVASRYTYCVIPVHYSLHIQVHVDVRVTWSFSSASLAWTVQHKLRLDSYK